MTRRIVPVALVMFAGALAWQHTHFWGRVLAVLALILARAVYVHVQSYRRCLWCRGERGRRSGCWRCKGTGMTRRWGAWHTHRLALAIRQVLAERRAGK